MFEAIDHNFGGLESISSQNLYMLDCTKAHIEVKRDLCGFLLAIIEFKDKKEGIRFLDLVMLLS